MYEDQHPLTPAERELERALAGLSPAPPPDHRESIAYAAGYRAARRQTTLWRTSSLALAASLALALLLRPAPQTATQYVSSPPPPTPPSPQLPITLASSAPSPLPTNAYLSLRDQVLDHGLDALPPTPTGPSPTPAPRVRTVQPDPITTLFGDRS